MSEYEIRSNYRLRIHLASDLRLRFPYWDYLTVPRKIARLDAVIPLYQERWSNITTENLIRHITDKLMGQAVADVSHYAIGSGTTPPSITDTDMVTRENTQIITAIQDSGLTLETSTFWDTTEANGITFAEGGILAGGTPGTPGSGGILLARVVFATPQTKDSTKTFTVDHDLTGTPK